jgi:hypothetical protein
MLACAQLLQTDHTAVMKASTLLHISSGSSSKCRGCCCCAAAAAAQGSAANQVSPY